MSWASVSQGFVLVPGGDEPREEELAVAPEQRVAQDREELVLPDARADGRLELGEHRVADPAVHGHELDLLGGLHLPRVDRRRARVDDPEPLGLEREEPDRVEAIDGQRLPVEPHLPQHRAEGLGPLRAPWRPTRPRRTAR